MRDESSVLEGRNVVLEALRSDITVEKLFVQRHSEDGPIQTILREAKKQRIPVDFVEKERLNQMSETKKHQGVIAYTAAYAYATVEQMLALAAQRGEPPFLFLLDGIEDPHNLGAIIRTANVCGAHGVIVPERRSAGLSATVAKASAGAIGHTLVARVKNLNATMEKLKGEGLWFVCGDMDGTLMYDCGLTGPIGLVIGGEGDGVSPLLRKNCDYVARIPMHGEIDSLNASVACGVLAYEILRQRMPKGQV